MRVPIAQTIEEADIGAFGVPVEDALTYRPDRRQQHVATSVVLDLVTVLEDCAPTSAFEKPFNKWLFFKENATAPLNQTLDFA
jgi:hypothetical protein